MARSRCRAACLGKFQSVPIDPGHTQIFKGELPELADRQALPDLVLRDRERAAFDFLPFDCGRGDLDFGMKQAEDLEAAIVYVPLDAGDFLPGSIKNVGVSIRLRVIFLRPGKGRVDGIHQLRRRLGVDSFQRRAFDLQSQPALFQTSPVIETELQGIAGDFAR